MNLYIRDENMYSKICTSPIILLSYKETKDYVKKKNQDFKNLKYHTYKLILKTLNINKKMLIRGG